MVMLYFSKYSNIKLGKDTDKPEFNDISWFMMLFACGIGVGLFFYGVAEPVFHYTGRNRYTADPTIPDNTLAQIAINLTLFHWGKMIKSSKKYSRRLLLKTQRPRFLILKGFKAIFKFILILITFTRND